MDKKIYLVQNKVDMWTKKVYAENVKEAIEKYCAYFEGQESTPEDKILDNVISIGQTSEIPLIL